MYTEVASKLALATGAGTFAYSQAVSMNGGNAVQMNCTLYNLSASGTLKAFLQEGNDLENWSDVAGSLVLTGAGYGTLKATAIASAYVRVKYESSGSSNFAIVAAGLNVAQL